MIGNHCNNIIEWDGDSSSRQTTNNFRSAVNNIIKSYYCVFACNISVVVVVKLTDLEMLLYLVSWFSTRYLKQIRNVYTKIIWLFIIIIVCILFRWDIIMFLKKKLISLSKTK